MVSELFRSMALDVSSQGLDSTTKMKMIPLKSIVSDFQQELQNQMAIFNQFLNQKLDEMAIENAKTHAIVREVRNTVSKTVLCTASPRLHIESGGFTSNDEEFVYGQIPDVGHNDVAVTTAVKDEGEENKEKNEEKEESIDYCENDSNQNESGIQSDLIQSVYQSPPISPIGFLQPDDSTRMTRGFLKPLMFPPPWNWTKAVERELSVEKSEASARPKPNQVISTWARLMPINVYMDFVTFTITTHRRIGLGGDYRKPLPPPLPPPPWPALLPLPPPLSLPSPPLPPPSLPLAPTSCVVTRLMPNSHGSACNRWLEKLNRTSRFYTCLYVTEIEKISQYREEENHGVEGFLKEKSQEVEYVEEKNQKMEVFLNSIVGALGTVLGSKIIKLEGLSSGRLGVVQGGGLLRSIMDILEIKTHSGYLQQYHNGHSVRPISTLSIGSSTLVQSSNPFAIQFAAVLKEEGKDEVWCWSSLVHSTQETKGVSMFQIAELDRWSSTMILKSRGERMLNCKGLILMRVGWRVVVIAQQRFFYFFYPP